ncbi:hypothetical protein GCM10025878_17540 [Leuconostoc gasicomitatum]|mgnify:FL=1|uniref:Uncharacterized protein n=2 Tax=Leuconostoc TaxID=1243 RepID=A0AAN2QVX4_9LACO|nr:MULTISPECIES: hypothetical protein [Leuconostoc]MBZ5948321.1 hypothetical protein [Leuconostoc gasicomitatum]MBZ5956419.1 hypothetical protein [Leuconostoc gasicomitatum]MBZ5959621.1 hypothetical protein [Leuconostoc gasicomitatum]MBZ5963149.1 hypothetical protein [Leuconostoc gasicomitatum]MBZ5966354.1 hypothetical protein [Leuconostoc gasicomitatum]
MAKIVNREEQLVNSFDDLISLPIEDTSEDSRAAALGRESTSDTEKK